MSDDRVRKNYPAIVDRPDTEGDEGNPGVPTDYLEQIAQGADPDEVKA